MPGSGTPFNSFALPYRIRVDAFTELPETEQQPALHLLTHTHSDHLSGLSSKSFSSFIYCSQDAKEMLLRHQVFRSRKLYQNKIKAEKKRTFSHLKVGPVMRPDGSLWFFGARDLLKALPLDTPTRIELEEGEEITLTLIDANHCPGAVMYLIEGQRGAVLHTGDFRVEPWFLESLAQKPYLQPYLQSSKDEPFVNTTLEAIYIDTAGAFCTLPVPTKEHATTGLIELLKCYPATTHFFINAWTWGFEDILKSIARAFQCQIHVDWYKYSVYQHVSDPFLRSIITTDADSTRFHACERFHRCNHVAVDTGLAEYGVPVKSRKGHWVVYVDPVPIEVESWNDYVEDTKKAICVMGEAVNSVLVPLARHSSLPELQSFVRLFRPKRVIPNSLSSHLSGFDWACLDHMFRACLSPTSSNNNKIPPTPQTIDKDLLAFLADEEFGPEIKNIVGSSDVTSKWAGKASLWDALIENLDPGVNPFVDGLLDVRPPKEQVMTSEGPMLRRLDVFGVPNYQHVMDIGEEKRNDGDSEDGSDDDVDREEEHWRTAEALFGDSETNEDANPQSDQSKSLEKGKERQSPQLTINTTHRPMTPPPSPARHTRTKRIREESNPGILPRKRTITETHPPTLGSPPHLRENLATASKEISLELTPENRGCIQIESRRPTHSDVEEPSLLTSPRLKGRRDTQSVSHLRHIHHRNPEVSESSLRSGRDRQSVFVPHRERVSISRAYNVPSPSSALSEAIIHRKRNDIERTRQSLEMAEKLARVNPGSVVSTYRQARERLLKECARNEVQVQYLEALMSNVQSVAADLFFVDELLAKQT